MKDFTGSAALPVQVVRGRAAVLSWKEKLVALSERCGQSGAMAHLEYYLARPAFVRKKPTLILTFRRDRDDLEAAVLVYEYQVMGIGCRLVVSDYVGTFQTVIAPAGERAKAAFVAGKILAQRGALLAHVSYEGEQPRMDPVARERRAAGGWMTWAILQRQTIGYVRVEDTVDATLAHLGKHTRRNLRYYRRRADTTLKQELIDHPQITVNEFVNFSRVCTFPLTEAQALKRHGTIKQMPPNYLFLGIRAANGDWLSMIGGRSHEGNTHIEWQMNRADMSSHSLCTLMRSHLIEYEVNRKTRKIYFVGGTGHSIRTALIPEVKVADLMVLNGWVPRRLLLKLAPPDSFVGEMLANTALEWHRWWRIPPATMSGDNSSPAIDSLSASEGAL